MLSNQSNLKCSFTGLSIIHRIKYHFPDGDINFDLEDCDKILRVEAESISVQSILKLLKQHGFHAEVLI